MGLDYLAMVSATWQIQLHAYHHVQVLESRQGGAMTERPALACYESVPQTLDSVPSRRLSRLLG